MNFYGNTAIVEFLNVNLTPGSVLDHGGVSDSHSEPSGGVFSQETSELRFQIATLMENTAVMLRNKILVVLLKQSAKRGEQNVCSTEI